MTAPPATPALALVYENAAVAAALLALLRDEGYAPVAFAVETAAQLQPVIDWLVAQAPALCLYELPYPFQTGWAHLAVLRARAPATAFIVLCDDPQPPDLADTVAPAVQLLPKPFEFSDLLTTLGQVVNHHVDTES